MNNNENLSKMKFGLPPSVLMTMIVCNGSSGTEYGPDHIARALIKVNPANTNRSYVLPAPLFDPKLKNNPYKGLSDNIEQEPTSTRVLLLAGDLAAVGPSIDADLKKHGDNLRVLWISRRTGLAPSRELRPEKSEIPTGTSVMKKLSPASLKRQRQIYDDNTDRNSTLSSYTSSLSPSKTARAQDGEDGRARRKQVTYASQEDVFERSKQYPLSALLGHDGTVKYWEMNPWDDENDGKQGTYDAPNLKGTLRTLPPTSVLCIGQHFRPPSTYLHKHRPPLLTPHPPSASSRGRTERQAMDVFPSLASSVSAVTDDTVKEGTSTPHTTSPVTVIQTKDDHVQRYSGIEEDVGEENGQKDRFPSLEGVVRRHRIAFEEEQGISEEMKHDWLAAKDAGVMVIPYGADDVIDFLPDNITTLESTLESPRHAFLDSNVPAEIDTYGATEDILEGQEIQVPVSAAAMERTHRRLSSLDRVPPHSLSAQESLFSLSPDKSESTITIPQTRQYLRTPTSSPSPSPPPRVGHESRSSGGSPSPPLSQLRSPSVSQHPVSPLTGSPLTGPPLGPSQLRSPVQPSMAMTREPGTRQQRITPTTPMRTSTPTSTGREDEELSTPPPPPPQRRSRRTVSEVKYEDIRESHGASDLENMSNVTIPSGASIFHDSNTGYEQDERPFVQVYNPYQGPMHYPGDAIATLNQVSPLIPAMSARGKSIVEDEDLMGDEGIACIVRATQCIHQSFHCGLMFNEPAPASLQQQQTTDGTRLSTTTTPHSTPVYTPHSTIVHDETSDTPTTDGFMSTGADSVVTHSPSPRRTSTSGRPVTKTRQIPSRIGSTTRRFAPDTPGTTSSPISTSSPQPSRPGVVDTADPRGASRGGVPLSERDYASVASGSTGVRSVQFPTQAGTWSTKSVQSGEMGVPVYHVVLDLEAISSMDIPCAGSTVTSRTTLRPGLRLDQVLSLLMTLPGPFISLDIVGYNPLRGDPEELASVQQSILSIIKTFAEGAMLQQLSHEQLPPPPSDVVAASLEANLAARYTDYTSDLDPFSPFSEESPNTSLLRTSTEAMRLSPHSPQHRRDESMRSTRSKPMRYSMASSASSTHPIRLYRSLSQVPSPSQEYLDYDIQTPPPTPGTPTTSADEADGYKHQHSSTMIDRMTPEKDFAYETPKSPTKESPTTPGTTTTTGTAISRADTLRSLTGVEDAKGRTHQELRGSYRRYPSMVSDTVLSSVSPYVSPVTGVGSPETFDYIDPHATRRSLSTLSEMDEITHSVYCDPAPRSQLSRRSSSLIDSFDPLVRTATVMPESSYQVVPVETPPLKTPGSLSSGQETEEEAFDGHMTEDTTAYSTITPSPLVDERQRHHARSRSRGVFGGRAGSRASSRSSRGRAYAFGTKKDVSSGSETGIASSEQQPVSYAPLYASPYTGGRYGTRIPTLTLPQRTPPHTQDVTEGTPSRSPAQPSTSATGDVGRDGGEAEGEVRTVLLMSPTLSSRTAEIEGPRAPESAVAHDERKISEDEEEAIGAERMASPESRPESTAIGDERIRVRRAYSTTDAELYNAWRRLGHGDIAPVSETAAAGDKYATQRSGLSTGAETPEAVGTRDNDESEDIAGRDVAGRREGVRPYRMGAPGVAGGGGESGFDLVSDADFNEWRTRRDFINRSRHVRHGSIEFQPRHRHAISRPSFGVLSEPRVESTEGGKQVIVRSNLPGQSVASSVAPVKVSLPVENAAALAIAMGGKIERLPFASIMPSRTALEMPPEIEVSRMPPTPTSDMSSVT